MLGILTTLQVGVGSQLVPVACPVALVRLDDTTQPTTGLIERHTPCHAGYATTLEAAT